MGMLPVEGAGSFWAWAGVVRAGFCVCIGPCPWPKFCGVVVLLCWHDAPNSSIEHKVAGIVKLKSFMMPPLPAGEHSRCVGFVEKGQTKPATPGNAGR
jgi:hypothetical protein